MTRRQAARQASVEPVVVDEITLEGQQVRVQSVDLPLAKVKLDPANPRYANTFASESPTKNDARLQARLEEYLWADSDVHGLSRQIVANGGLIERIIVRHDGTVVEGNCRTVVYRKLHEENPKDRTWASIPARVLPEDIGDKNVAILLGEMHITGKNTWSAFEKAGHVYRLHKDFALSQEEIAQRLRMSKSKVNQLIRAFDVMKNRYLAKHSGAGAIHKFSHFEELFKKPDLRDWAQSDAIDEFVEWVADGRLAQGTQVRDLPQILSNKRSLKALTANGYAAAMKVLEEENPAITSPLFRRMVEMTEAIKRVQLDEIQVVRRSRNETTRRIVRELRAELDRFAEFCGLADAEGE
jgi:hypothetical protein